tara:strand:- start:561 stop:944 length:384 start_codon:yes stop_codon:yes gene_type:complete
MTNILVPISLGELIDKITILEIKAQRLNLDSHILVISELKALKLILDDLKIEISESLINNLRKINLELWEIEDEIRCKEKHKDFGSSFIDLARSVYKKNDKRAAIKKDINIIYNSEFIEVKSYQNYD